jgi:hypothetical protein
MNVMLKNVLELQLSILHELRNDVEAELQSRQLEKLPLSGPELVNSRTATNEIGADTTEASGRPFEQKVTHGNNASIKLGIFESICSKDMRADIKTMQPTASDGSNAKCNFARACMVRISRPTIDASNSLGDSNYFELPRHSGVSDASAKYKSSPDPSRSEASSGLVSSDGNRRSTRNKRERYTVPKESDEVQNKANARINKALNQVPPATHSNKDTKRSEATLYIGNLEYSATIKELDDALSKYFKRIHIEEIVIPSANGRSRGYAFVTLSWPAGSPVNPKDICKLHSGMIDVNSRPIYLRELRKHNMESSTRAKATEGLAPQSPGLNGWMAGWMVEQLQRDALNSTSEDEAEFGGLSDSSME